MFGYHGGHVRQVLLNKGHFSVDSQHTTAPSSEFLHPHVYLPGPFDSGRAGFGEFGARALVLTCLIGAVASVGFGGSAWVAGPSPAGTTLRNTCTQHLW